MCIRFSTKDYVRVGRCFGYLHQSSISLLCFFLSGNLRFAHGIPFEVVVCSFARLSAMRVTEFEMESVSLHTTPSMSFEPRVNFF